MSVTKGLESVKKPRRGARRADTQAIEYTGPDPSLVASEQASEERVVLQGLLARLAKGLAGWQEQGWRWTDPDDSNTDSWKGVHRLAYLYAQASWTEARLDVMTTMKTPVWCPGCKPDGWPGPRWMKYECLEHSRDMNTRSALSWGRMVLT